MFKREKRKKREKIIDFLKDYSLLLSEAKYKAKLEGVPKY